MKNQDTLRRTGMKTSIEGLTETQALTVLEIVRISLNDESIFDFIGDSTDMCDEELKDIRDKISDFMN